MRRITILTATLLLAALTALPALATELTDMDICVGRSVLARGLCKTPAQINYVSKVRDNIYLFSVFYANKEAHFFVGVYKDIIRIQGKEFRKVTRSIPYDFDKESKCAVVNYSVPDCPNSEPIVCCSEKTIEEKMDDKFWDRTIPELLEEDLQKALKADNATQPGQGTPQQPGQ
ncbi:hypothetical protein GM415_00830 [Pseudodesulfovibrio cashew]|uniref:Uncharacterized protein n=1 Tax=Pseudodesulfovibrio cashew TaxID=2678688 RepID=A0A6I6JDN8_9BACT|nr:hypothetical protein [Pseudodesulfovibrio cashew]QGY38743.1 hypothetical protein GM415_00830 [Pseudodesulfovibrio cashew]